MYEGKVSQHTPAEHVSLPETKQIILIKIVT